MLVEIFPGDFVRADSVRRVEVERLYKGYNENYHYRVAIKFDSGDDYILEYKEDREQALETSAEIARRVNEALLSHETKPG